MVKPFDVSKFRKDTTKSIDGLSIGIIGTGKMLICFFMSYQLTLASLRF